MTAVAAPGQPMLRLGPRSYPVVLPKLRDPRLKVSATVITVHVLGQVWLGFPLSIAQILVAVFTCAVIELVVLFWRRRAIVWPASAMLTGVGVALILRVVGTRHGDWWSMEGWYIFAGVAAASLLSKYLIRPQGTQIFNPNNMVLTLAFLLLGSSLVEPLDFWWGPMSPALAAAIAAIMIGGLAVTSQLRLLAMPLVFWATFAALLGVVAASGHCITARWAVDPVCDGTFWRIVVTSPELLIFMFFMITDPKAIPHGQVGRVAFAMGVALLAVLFIAPQRTEFGAKVGLLGSMAVFSAVHMYFDRSFPAAGGEEDRLARWVRSAGRRWRQPARATLLTGGVGVFIVVVLLAGDVARSPAGSTLLSAAASERSEPATEAVALPPVTIREDAADIYGGISEQQAQMIGQDLASGLALQAEALRSRDPILAEAAVDDSQLWAVQRQIEAAGADGEILVPFYEFESMEVVLIFGGDNKPPVLGVEAHGTVRELIYGGAGGDTLISETESPLASVFAVAAREDGGHYVVIGQVDVPDPDAVRPVEAHP